MGRPCSICQNADRPKIDKLLASGSPIRGIARTFRVSEDALGRHKEHLRQVVVKAAERREERFGDVLLEQIRGLGRKALELLAKMEGESDYRGSIVALREARECIGAQADLLMQAVKTETANSQQEITVTILEVGGEPSLTRTIQ
jgi:hypothetical protein